MRVCVTSAPREGSNREFQGTALQEMALDFFTLFARAYPEWC